MSVPGSEPPTSNEFSSEGEALQRMYRITSDYGRPFEEKIQDLLQLGREHLDVETAFFTELTSDTQVIVAAKSENNDIQAGASCPLEESYCRRTINQDSAVNYRALLNR